MKLMEKRQLAGLGDSTRNVGITAMPADQDTVEPSAGAGSRITTVKLQMELHSKPAQGIAALASAGHRSPDLSCNCRFSLHGAKDDHHPLSRFRHI